jgi:hypothetical protein
MLFQCFDDKIMRTTLALDEDVFIIAKQKAARENITIGKAVSELMRIGIRSESFPAQPRPVIKSKYGVLPARDELITSEHVYSLMEQEGI